MARPRMNEMRANVTPSFSIPTSPAPAPGETIHPWTGSGGNPHLEPWRADAFDLSYEWYINRTSYFSVAFFYKDLETYIFNQALPFDFTGVPIPPNSQPVPNGVIVSNIGTMVLPANGDGGLIRGVEISGAFDFGVLNDALEGFGIIANYSRSTSNLNPVGCTETNPANCPATPPEVRIPGLSGEVYGLTGYFERGGFQARASYRYRSPFKGEVVQLFTNRGFTEILEDEQVDAQIGYTFQDGSPLEGLGFLLQVNNLTNSPYRTRLGLDTGGTTTADGTTLLETYEEYGRQILFGVNYRF
jgi:iron complex outermembrane receptor protein